MLQSTSPLQHAQPGCILSCFNNTQITGNPMVNQKVTLLNGKMGFWGFSLPLVDINIRHQSNPDSCIYVQAGTSWTELLVLPD